MMNEVPRRQFVFTIPKILRGIFRKRRDLLHLLFKTAIELFRHRFLHALREAKLISPGKLADLLSWKHSGFHIHDGGEKPVPAHDSGGRKRLAEYLLRHPFSLQKIT
jgi:hypothetical protein